MKLKSKVKVWIYNRQPNLKKELQSIEAEIALLLDLILPDYFSIHQQQEILDLALKRDKILKLQEEEWRQKSRLAWIKGGDRNTKKNHRAASKWRQINSIWAIQDD